jgi:hypothetical protein
MEVPENQNGAVPSVPRRRILASAAATGSAGCLGESDQPAQNIADTERSKERGSSGRPSASKAPQSSGRIGDTVYYDPNRPGPFADGQDALASVPNGGTFWLSSGIYDVSEEGRLLVTKPVHIQGTGNGWSNVNDRSENGSDPKYVGTVIKNYDSDEPAVEFRGDRSGKMINGTSIQGLKIKHSGESSPAVRFRNSIVSTIDNVKVNCRSTAPTGIEYDEWSFFARVVRSSITAFTDIGIHIPGTGYAHEFYSVHCATGRPDATALQTETHRTIVVGGEFACLGDNGTALRYYNPESSTLYGGLAIEPGIEGTDNPVDIDGESAFENVQLYHLLMPGIDEDRTGVRFGNARGAKLINPILTRGGKLAHWTEQSKHCGIVSDASTIAGCSLVDDGALNPYVSLTGATDDTTLKALPTTVPITVEYNTDANGPVYHDGSSWRQVADDEYTPT